MKYLNQVNAGRPGLHAVVVVSAFSDAAMTRTANRHPIVTTSFRRIRRMTS
jgi:hypothetical protein